MTLLRLTLEVAADGVAAAEAACWALGVQGLCVRDAETGRRDGRAEVVAWLDGEADGEAVRAQIAARAPAATVRLEPEDATTWTATLPTEPLRVGPIVIAAPGVAVHDPAPVLRLEPGLAFGSGAHPTTALCIDRLMSLRPRRALDVGTGTGVLALVCVLRGAREVIAVDVDPGSRAAARRHAALNDAADRVRVVDALPPAEPGFDVVVANLYVGPLASPRGAIWCWPASASTTRRRSRRATPTSASAWPGGATAMGGPACTCAGWTWTRVPRTDSIPPMRTFPLPERCAPTRPVSALHAHGADDGEVPDDGRDPYPGVEASATGCAIEVLGRGGVVDLPAPVDVNRLPGVEASVRRWSGCAAGGGAERWRMAGVRHQMPASQAFVTAVLTALDPR